MRCLLSSGCRCVNANCWIDHCYSCGNTAMPYMKIQAWFPFKWKEKPVVHEKKQNWVLSSKWQRWQFGTRRKSMKHLTLHLMWIVVAWLGISGYQAKSWRMSDVKWSANANIMNTPLPKMGLSLRTEVVCTKWFKVIHGGSHCRGLFVFSRFPLLF